jgi:hypothetical protein
VTGHTIHSNQCYAGHYQVFFIKNNLFTFGYQLEVVVKYKEIFFCNINYEGRGSFKLKMNYSKTDGKRL